MKILFNLLWYPQIVLFYFHYPVVHTVNHMCPYLLVQLIAVKLATDKISDFDFRSTVPTTEEEVNLVSNCSWL